MAPHRHTRKSIRIFKKDFKQHFKMASLCFVLWFIMMSSGAMLFFYIEHCYAPMAYSNWGEVEKGYFSMCRILKNLTENSTAVMKNSSWIQNVTEICIPSSVEFRRPSCEFNFEVFEQWIEYAMTVGYTIGLGMIVPLSDVGKIATIFYAIPAIGMTMTFNIYVGNFFVDFTRMLIVYFETKFLMKRSVGHLNLKVFIHQVLAAGVVCVLSAELSRDFLLNKRFGVLMYFSFTTLSTIGFGELQYDPEVTYSDKLEINIMELIFLLLSFSVSLGVMASMLTGLSELITSTNVSSKEHKENKFIKNILKRTVTSKRKQKTSHHSGDSNHEIMF